MSNRRIEVFEIRNVIVRMRLGDSDRQIAKAGLVGRPKAKEIRKVALEKGWLEVECEIPDNKAIAAALEKKSLMPVATSKVRDHADQLQKWHSDGIHGTVMLRALREQHQFEGSYSSVRRFIQRLDKANPKVTTVLDFQPGEVAQVDFGQGPEITDVRTGETFKTQIFVMTLCWSRHQYVELVLNQKVATWLGCHRRAFEFFGGLPKVITIDNAKCAITKACYYDPEVQRSYAAFAEYYGFKINACPPRDPQKKGTVEAGVKYVKNNFVPLREFRSLKDSNNQALAWVMGEAGNRIHGTTREKPLTRFLETEKSLLKGLPPVAMDIVIWAKAKLHGNCHIQYEKCRYSAPFRLVNATLWIKVSEKLVEIYHDHELVASHARLHKPGSRSTVADHMPPNALAYKMRDPQWCLKQAAVIGPHCLQVIEKLFANRVVDNLNAAQGVINLKNKFGAQRLEAACQRAIDHDSVLYRTIKQILEKGLDAEGFPSLSKAPLSLTYQGAGRFCRDTAELLH